MCRFLAIAALGAAAALAGCGRVNQSASCREFVACVRAQDAVDGVTTDATRFEPDGDCWGGPDIAELCDRSCVHGTAQLRADHSTLACAVTP